MAQKINPGEDIYLEAMNYDLSDGIYPQDKKEALRLYKKAADLGCLQAYTKIGEMYEEGEGVNASEEKAIEYYRKGVNCGNVYCYYKMASLFIINKKDLINSQQCFQLFAEKFKEIGPANNLRMHEDDLRHITFEVVVHCQKFVANDKELMSRPSYFPLLPEYNKFVMEISLALFDHVVKRFDEFIAKGEEFNNMKKALEYFLTYAKENSE
jgi:hypothetical protein